MRRIPPTAASPISPPWRVVDLFSGAGGMSFGFHAHPSFRVVGAVDVEIGKPSTGHGAIECNSTYAANIGVTPLALDLGAVEPTALRDALAPAIAGEPLTVLLACPPCTGFSRAVAKNHVVDDPRNSLVARVASFVQELSPQIVVMENARELITGKFSTHYQLLRSRLDALGYAVHGATHFLNRFGLPQERERALIVAAKRPLRLRTVEELWSGFTVRPRATHVRRAIGRLPPVEAGETHPSDPLHSCTDFWDSATRRRIMAIPHDGGSWNDLIDHPQAKQLLIPVMWRAVEKGRPNSHCDVYGRMWWDRPAPTIKRECAHVGNGRYAHPEQDRLCTVREMSILQGFPADYRFVARSRKNMYRHIGDAVPPLVSFQLAHLCEWILTGVRPEIASIVLPRTHLTAQDVQPSRETLPLFAHSVL